MPQSLGGDQLCATNMQFFNPNNVPQNTPPDRELFQLWVFFFQPRHLPPPPPCWVEISPAGVNLFSPPPPRGQSSSKILTLASPLSSPYSP